MPSWKYQPCTKHGLPLLTGFAFNFWDTKDYLFPNSHFTPPFLCPLRLWQFAVEGSELFLWQHKSTPKAWCSAGWAPEYNIVRKYKYCVYPGTFGELSLCFLTLKTARNWRKGQTFRSQIQPEKKKHLQSREKVYSYCVSCLGRIRRSQGRYQPAESNFSSFWDALLNLYYRELLVKAFWIKPHCPNTPWRFPPGMALVSQWSVASLGWPSVRSLSWRTISLCNISLQRVFGGVGSSQVVSCSPKKTSPGSA